MAFERKWAAIAPVSFTQDGSSLGTITVADAAGFYVKQTIVLSSVTQSAKQLQIKWILSPTQMVVGLPDNKVGRTFGVDVSAFKFAENAQVSAGEQDKNNIPEKDHYAAVYEADPIVADRVILVDNHGDHIGANNPLPIQFDGTINIGDVHVQGTNGNVLQPNADGSLNVIFDGGNSTTLIKSAYAEAAAVPTGQQATIITFVVPGSATATLQRVFVSGENLARYDVQVNGSTVETQRTYWGNLNTSFNFMTDASNGGLALSPGDVVTVLVLNNSPSGSSSDFEARVQIAQTQMN